MMRREMRDLVSCPGSCATRICGPTWARARRAWPRAFGNVYEDDTLEGMARRVLDAAPAALRPDRLLDGRVRGPGDRVDGARAGARRGLRRQLGARLRRRRSERAQGAAPGDAGQSPVRADRPGVSALGLHPDRERDPVLLERLRAMPRRLGREVGRASSHWSASDGYADLERIACPRWWWPAARTACARFEETERMARHLPHARFEVIEDCGHMAPMERPVELAAILDDWICREAL